MFTRRVEIAGVIEVDAKLSEHESAGRISPERAAHYRRCLDKGLNDLMESGARVSDKDEEVVKQQRIAEAKEPKRLMAPRADDGASGDDGLREAGSDDLK